MKKQLALVLLCLAVSIALAGCNGNYYLATRAIRQVTGKKMRFHPIEPMQDVLAAQYRLLEVKKFDNFMLDQIPPPMEQYLNDRVFKELQASALFSEVVRPHDEATPEEKVTESSKPTLIFEGAIDDYSPGYRGLRYLELGFNHVAVTVRFQLRDKLTGEVIGSASITAQDNRATGSAKSAIDRIAKRIDGFMKSESRKHPRRVAEIQ
jgi:hypothetical protein